MSGSVGFSYRVSLPEIKAEQFLDAVRTACREALIRAARKFLLAALPRVPVFTGFARGAFGNLEDAVGRYTSGGKGGPKINSKAGGLTKAQSFAKRPYYYYPGGKASKIVRNTVTGRPFATKTEEIFSQGHAKVATDESVIFFRFSIDINYVNYLDRNKWGAFKAGESAFNVELKEQLKALLPQIGKYLIKKDVK